MHETPIATLAGFMGAVIFSAINWGGLALIFGVVAALLVAGFLLMIWVKVDNIGREQKATSSELGKLKGQVTELKTTLSKDDA